MKKLNLIKRLWTDSHEKQSPQRFGRYAVMLIMLLSLGVGQIRAADDTLENSSHIYFCNKDCGNFRTANAVPKLNLHIKNTDNWTLICGTSLGNDYWDFVIPSSGDYDQVQIGRYSACDGTDWTCWSNKLNVSDRPSNSHNYLHMTESNWTQTLTWRTWTIAGSNTDLLGSSWTFNASSNDMEFDPATQTFSLTKTFTSSSSNLSIEYKAGMDHGTSTTIGNNGSNKSFTITYPGTYAITFTLNAAQNAVTEVVKRQFCDTELSSTGGSSSTINLSCYIVDSKYRIVIKGTGLTGISDGVYFKYGGTGEGRQLKSYATTVSNTSTNITYDIPWNALPPLFYTKLFVLYPGESQFAQIENQEIDWEHSCVVTYYSVTYDGSDATNGSAPTDDNSYESGENVTVAAKPDGLIKTNYIFSGWNTSSDMSGTTYVAAATFSISSNTTLYAKWTQGIVLNANKDYHGTGDDKNVTAIWNKAALEDGFSPTTGEIGYTLDGYYTTAVGGTKVLNADGSFADTNVSGYITSGKWSHTGSAPTLYAHWVADTWILKSTDTKLGDFVNTGTDEYRLNINITDDNKNNWHFFRNSTIEYHYGAVNPLNEDVTLTQAAGQLEWKGGSIGHYTLKIWKDGDTWKYRAYASPQINFTASPSNGSVSASSNWEDAVAAGSYVMYGSDVTFTATPASHYTLEGWYSASDFSGDNLGTTNPLTVSNVTSNTARYAKFALEQYTITLDIDESHHGTIDGKTTSQVVDYRGATTTVPYLPTGADGYKFMGFYTETGGGGTQVINADGTWIASVDGYTDEDKNWIHDADATLYAYYQAATITNLELPGGSLYTVGGSAFTATATVSAFDGNALVCWAVLNSSEEEVSTTFTPASGNSVTVSIPATPGSYKVVATLREGSVCNSGTVLDTEEQSFTVQGNYTVSITNGSGSSSVGEVTTATATADAAAAGMKFDHWNVTGTISYTSGDVNSRTITFNASSNISLTAVYVEDFSTGWYLATDAFDAGSWVEEKTEFLKRTGETTGSIAYVSYDLNRAGSYPTNNQFRFKIKDRNTSSTYGDNSAGTMTYGNCTDWSLVDASSKDVTKVNVNVTGTYTFKLDYANMKISVIYPVVNQLQVYTTTGTDGATIINDYDWTQTAGVYSQELELEEATTYTFKVVKNSVHYGNSTTLSASNKSATLTTDGGNISLTTTSAGTYTISYNPTTDQVSVSLNDESLTTVAVEYGWGGLTKNVTVGDFTYPTITATVPEGMNFDSWTHTGTVTYGSSTSTSTTITSATSGAKVTATFNSDKIIYFDNSASNWNDENGIWVYLFSSTYGVWYDDEVDGGVHPRQNRLEYGRMTRIGTSKIYYYKYSTNTTIAGVAFTKADQHNYDAFNGTSAAWLTSFNTCQPCYIASYVYTSKNGVGYHSTGYWKKYGTYDSGFSLWIYYNGLYHENKFTTTDPTSFVYTTSDELTSAGSAYNYHVTRCAGSNLRRKDYNGAIAASDSDYPRELIDNASDGTITTSSAGEYNFTLDLSGDHIYMYTEYPLTVGDYRVVLNNGTKDHPSGRIVRARSESVSDTVSFFINKDATNTLHVDTCTSTYPSVVWETIKDVSASGLSLNRGPYKSTTGVYNFMITHSRYKDVSLDSITDEKKVYTGNYYIRTDAADGKWKTYITTPDNMMQHSAKSLNTEAQFDYYFTKYVLHDGNLQFTIANDYSPCISDTLYGDTYTGGADKSHQTLLADANVRYMWNSGTNVISRAYLDPATTEGSQFIKLHSSDGKLFLSSATNESHGDPLTSIVFTDTKNWIYQADVKALPNAVATLTAEYNDNNIDIISGGKAQKLFGGDSEDGETLYPLRMVYDFKTNILVSAWIAESDQTLGTTNLALDADLMIVRKLQEPAAQITFTTGSLSDVKTIYGALRFDYDDMVGNLSSWTGNYGKLIYDVSFPFDVNVKDIFGVGNMDDHWVVQKYNGARRAKDGWFMESKPFWETLTEDSVMHAYEGYTVIIDRPSFNSSTSVVWQNKLPGSSVYLYFPSASVDSKTISHGDVTIHLDSLNCKKDQWFTDPNTSQRLNHKFTDSNWRMLGVPLLSNDRGNFSSLFKSLLDYTDENPFGYLYTWSTVDNSYSITSTSDFTFKAMHSYMVQFAGDVTFTGSYVHAPSPSSIVAAKRTEGERHYTVKLQMANANIDDVTSQTYVELRNNACDTFALNEDVYMVRSSNIADLYTFAGAYDVAANVLSVGNHVVPVGMDVKQAGMYTFSMPSDFSGTVTLVDTQAGTRTNLSLNSYEIYLNRGAINDRFYLDIDIQEVITSVENVEGSNAINDGGAHKFLQNGQMYILKNGVIYDAKGNRVK